MSPSLLRRRGRRRRSEQLGRGRAGQGRRERVETFERTRSRRPPLGSPRPHSLSLGGGCFLRRGCDLPPRPRPASPAAALLACRRLFHCVQSGKRQGWTPPFLLRKPESAHWRFANPHPLTIQARDTASLGGLRLGRSGAQGTVWFSESSSGNDQDSTGRQELPECSPQGQTVQAFPSPAFSCPPEIGGRRRLGSLGGAISSPPEIPVRPRMVFG